MNLALALALVWPAAAGGDTPRSVVVGRSVQGRAIEAVRLGDPRSDRKAVVVGNVHGDEPAGLAVTRALRAREIRGVDLWVIDSANPDGLRRRTRRNARGVDLNRNFPVRWRRSAPGSRYYGGPKPFSEPESRAVRRLVERLRPAVSIWYHQPWGAVLAPRRGPVRVQRRYAGLARWPLQRGRGQGLPGTAIRWTNTTVPAGTAFVVELRGGGISAAQARRHARAAAIVAAGG